MLLHLFHTPTLLLMVKMFVQAGERGRGNFLTLQQILDTYPMEGPGPFSIASGGRMNNKINGRIFFIDIQHCQKFIYRNYHFERKNKNL